MYETVKEYKRTVIHVFKKFGEDMNKLISEFIDDTKISQIKYERQVRI